MKVRFQADADLHEGIVRILRRRRPALEFRTATEADLEGKNDAEVLRIAEDEGRVLVSHDRKTMPDAFGEFVAAGGSVGVLLISQSLNPHEAAEELLLIWEATEADEWVDVIASIPL